MRTPVGTECQYYYEDFNRGREIQECRLIEHSPRSGRWQPSLCRTCPVPAILRANACPNIVLEGWVGRQWLVLSRVKVRAFCLLAQSEVAEPRVGCGRCHEGRWRESLRGQDTTDSRFVP